MTRTLALLLLLATGGASAQSLVGVEVDVGGPFDDLTETDLDGDGRDDLLFLMPGSPPFLQVRYQETEGQGFTRRTRWPIPPGTAALMIADVLPTPGHDVLLLSSLGVQVIEGTSKVGRPQPWLSAPLLFPPGYRRSPSHWGWGRDLDGDGRQDLVLPGIDQDMIVFGGADGRPRGAPVPLAQPRSRGTADRTQGLLRIRRGRPRTSFAEASQGGAIPVWLEPDGLHVLPREGAGFAAASVNLFPLSQGPPSGLGLLRRVDVDLEDLDGDGLADLCLTRTEARGQGVPERRTDLVLFRNIGKPNPDPSQVILLPGVLSSGPHVADVGGDGNNDLLLSVFAGDLKSEVSRRLLGRVRLDYYLYLGTGTQPPFPRSPSLTLTDKVETATFETWGLRHRRMISDDWNGDGRADLVLTRSTGDRCRVEIRFAHVPGEAYGFADKGMTFTWKGRVVRYKSTSIQPGKPAIRLETPTGVAYIMRP